jgi:hypothetical protein
MAQRRDLQTRRTHLARKYFRPDAMLLAQSKVLLVLGVVVRSHPRRV